VSEMTSNLPFNLSEGVEGIVREAERALGRGEAALGRGEARVEDLAERFTHRSSSTEPATPASGSRGLADTLRTRELRPETVTPKKPSMEGKEVYSGPPLPLGFEPPPGYYLAPEPKSTKDTAEAHREALRQTLPLLVPQVKEFAAEEPIISQLASTIDSLTASLSTPTTSPSVDATGILVKAQDDLTSLSKRLEDVKKAEKEKLEKTVGQKTKEFEEVLREKEEERQKGEQGMKEGWDRERQKMVDEWRSALDSELETQRGGIEQR